MKDFKNISGLGQVADNYDALLCDIWGVIHNGEQPFIEAFPASVTYTVNLDTNFEDREAFVTGFSKYLEEATVQSDLVGLGL